MLVMPADGHTDYLVSSLCSYFAHMDLGIYSDLRIDQMMTDLSKVYQGRRANSASENPGDLSNGWS